jgi:transcriptional regulator with XRE-family HTH domain
MTQEQLVAIAGVSSITLSRLEGSISKPTFDVLIKLAEVLGESPDRLIGWRDPDRPADDREALLRQLDSAVADLSKEWVEALLAIAALARGK